MNILLATDGSDCAQQAVEFLRHFPFPEDGRLTLLTVIDKEFFKSRKKSELNAKQKKQLHESKKMLKEEGQQFLEEQAKTLGQAGRKVSTLVRSGHPAEEIVLVAKELEVDLVIMGSHGLTGIERFLLGSVSNHVLRHAPCSVLIVKRRGAADSPLPEDQALRILIAYDGSKHARKAVEFMASFPLNAETHVRALSVLPVIKMFRQDINQRMSWVWQEKKLLAEQALKRIAHEVRWGHPQIDTELRQGADVSQEILDAAEQDKSDLIVLGHKGKGAIDRFLLGSVTTRIAQHAECSVLAVRVTPES